MRAHAVSSARAIARAPRVRLCVLALALLLAAACDATRPGPASSETRQGSQSHATTNSATPRLGSQAQQSTNSQTPTAPRPVTTPDACRQWACRARQTIALPGDHQVTLWLAGDQQSYQSRPVIELLEHGVAVQSWTSPRGDGWNGTLTCNAGGPEPNCDLITTLGMHASVAEMLILRGGRLVHPAGAEVVTNSTGMSAADLDDDGYLDVIGSTNDYQPNYAQGHNFWQTFQYRDDRLVLTGCAPQPNRAAAVPTRLLAGECPAI